MEVKSAPIITTTRPVHARDRLTLPAPMRWLLLLASFVGLVALYYVGSIHASTPNSDGATLALQGQAVVKGNVALQHWNLSLDSFWTVDVIFYAVAYLIVGLHPDVLYVLPALIAALVVVVGVLIARDGRRGGAAIAGVIALVALLAFPTHAMAYFYLRGALHIATALWALIAMYAVRRGRFGVGWVVAVVFLTAGMLGDLQTLAYGTIPLLIAGIVAMIRRRSLRSGAATASSAVVATVLAVAVRFLADQVGTYAIGSANPRAPIHQMERNIPHLLRLGANLLGVQNAVLGTGGVPSGLQRLHIVGAAVIVVCFLLALLRLVAGMVTGGPHDATTATAVPSNGPAHRRVAWWQSETERWRLDDALTIACFGPAAAFVLLTLTDQDPQYARYLTASVIFASILAGRVVARWWARTSFPWLTRSTAVVGVAVGLCFAAATGYTLSVPGPGQPASALVGLLARQHLTRGVGDYWSASIATVQSGGARTVRPVIAGAGGRLKPYRRESSDSWFTGSFQFLVIDTTITFGTVDMSTAVASWGQPAHVYTTGTYRVLVWPRPVSFASER